MNQAQNIGGREEYKARTEEEKDASNLYQLELDKKYMTAGQFRQDVNAADLLYPSMKEFGKTMILPRIKLNKYGKPVDLMKEFPAAKTIAHARVMAKNQYARWATENYEAASDDLRRGNNWMRQSQIKYLQSQIPHTELDRINANAMLVYNYSRYKYVKKKVSHSSMALQLISAFGSDTVDQSILHKMLGEVQHHWSTFKEGPNGERQYRIFNTPSVVQSIINLAAIKYEFIEKTGQLLSKPYDTKEYQIFFGITDAISLMLVSSEVTKKLTHWNQRGYALQALKYSIGFNNNRFESLLVGIIPRSGTVEKKFNLIAIPTGQVGFLEDGFLDNDAIFIIGVQPKSLTRTFYQSCDSIDALVSTCSVWNLHEQYAEVDYKPFDKHVKVKFVKSKFTGSSAVVGITSGKAGSITMTAKGEIVGKDFSIANTYPTMTTTLPQQAYTLVKKNISTYVEKDLLAESIVSLFKTIEQNINSFNDPVFKEDVIAIFERDFQMYEGIMSKSLIMEMMSAGATPDEVKRWTGLIGFRYPEGIFGQADRISRFSDNTNQYGKRPRYGNAK